MQYLLHDLLKLPLEERLDIIEQVIKATSSEEKQSVNIKYEKSYPCLKDRPDSQKLLLKE